MKLAIIGVGGLGGAIANGIIAAGGVELVVCGRRQSSVDAFAGRAHLERDARAAVVGADVVLLAVKPGGTAELLRHVADAVAQDALVVSCAAGVSLHKIAAGLVNTAFGLARAMPNIGAQRRASTTGYTLGSSCVPERDRPRIEQVFGAVGSTRELADEALLHAVTAVASSGPAFLLLAVEALTDAGVEQGLSRADALACARGALVAAAACLDPELEAMTVRAHVTSPGGTTAAGLSILEQGAVRGTFQRAVAAAVERSRGIAG